MSMFVFTLVCSFVYVCLSICLCVSLVRRYDEMADKLSAHPQDTEALVNLQHFLNTVSICVIFATTAKKSGLLARIYKHRRIGRMRTWTHFMKRAFFVCSISIWNHIFFPHWKPLFCYCFLQSSEDLRFRNSIMHYWSR